MLLQMFDKTLLLVVGDLKSVHVKELRLISMWRKWKGCCFHKLTFRITKRKGKIHTYQSNHGKVEIRLQIKSRGKRLQSRYQAQTFSEDAWFKKYSCEGSRLQLYKSNKPTELNKTATKSDIKMFIKLHTMNRILAVLNSNWSLYSFVYLKSLLKMMNCSFLL